MIYTSYTKYYRYTYIYNENGKIFKITILPLLISIKLTVSIYYLDRLIQILKTTILH